jgi:hypothetical protein
LVRSQLRQRFFGGVFMPIPRSQEDIEAEIASALVDYDDDVGAAWGRMRIEPERWPCPAGPREPGGFWVVALVDDRALWFNDIEEGFNWSRYATRGTLDEYLCDQTSFAEILERIAREQSAAAREQLRESGVPVDLRGAGAIGRRQTTYWDVAAATGPRYRIHFRDKAEFVLADSKYQTIEIRDIHPLLVQYAEPARTLYFSGTPLRPREVSLGVERAIRDASGSWRGLQDYAASPETVERVLRGGHGMLMRAPASICSLAAKLLEGAGIQCSILGDARPRVGMKALLLDRSYVVAGGFAFESIES